MVILKDGNSRRQISGRQLPRDNQHEHEHEKYLAHHENPHPANDRIPSIVIVAARAQAAPTLVTSTLAASTLAASTLAASTLVALTLGRFRRQHDPKSRADPVRQAFSLYHAAVKFGHEAHDGKTQPQMRPGVCVRSQRDHGFK